jgi:hypothetical protein
VSAAALGRHVHLVDAAGGAQLPLLGVAPELLAADAPAPVSATLALTAVPTSHDTAVGDPATLAAALQSAPAADLVVVDAGARLDGVQAALAVARGIPGPPGARNPDPLLLVATGTEAPALASAYALVKACAAGPAEVLVVGADPAAAAAAFAHLDEGARHFLARPLRLAAVVPDDPSLAVALAAGMSVHDAAAGSPAAAALHAVAERAPASAAAPVRPHPSPAPPRPAAFAAAGAAPAPLHAFGHAPPR